MLPIAAEKKRPVLAILEKLSQKQDSGDGYKKTGSTEEKPESDSSVAKKGAMQSFLSAIEAKDAAGMASALSNFVSLCSENNSEDEGE